MTPTHDPTPRRLAQARQRGDLPRSSLLAALGAVAGACAGLALARAFAWPRAWSLLQGVWSAAPRAQAPQDALDALERAAWAVGWLVAPVALGALLGASLANAAQVGLRLTWGAPLAQDRAPWTAGLSGLVVLAVGAERAWSALPSALHAPERLARAPSSAPAFLWEASWAVAAPCLAAWAACALAAWAWERRRWWRALRMTHPELAQEQREQQGAPELLHARAHARRALYEEADPWEGARVVIFSDAVGAAALRWADGEARPPVVALRCERADLAPFLLRARERGLATLRDEAAARALRALPVGAPLPSPLGAQAAEWLAEARKK